MQIKSNNIIIYFLGDIPLRQLVYRVHPLPKSMIPLVWDFGQLDAETEEAYARQIISRYVKRHLYIIIYYTLFFRFSLCSLHAIFVLKCF